MKNRAFTLIELLVVIAIIAILAAILFPVFAQAKAAAKKTADLSNLKQLATSIAIYTSDNDDTIISFPYAGRWSSPSYPNAGDYGPNNLFWSDILMPYVKSRGIFSNSTNTDPVYATGGYLNPGQQNAADTDLTRRYRVTYALNHMISRAEQAPTPNAGGVPTTAVDLPAEIALFGPSQYAWTWSSCQAEGTETKWFWNVSTGGWGYELFGAMNNQSRIPNAGFNGGANFAFIDGHAAYAKVTRGGALGSPTATSGGLFSGYFPRVKTSNKAAAGGTCPWDGPGGIAVYAY